VVFRTPEEGVGIPVSRTGVVCRASVPAPGVAAILYRRGSR